MTNLFVAVSKQGEPMLAKYDPTVSILPAWRSKEAVETYIASIQQSELFSATELTFEIYDSAKDWHQKAGLKLFIHLN